MPHKRNPILSENLTGIARYIRGAVIPFMENIALWHERDISHSSVERILAPDTTTAIDFAINRMASIIKKLIVYPKKMENNLNKLGGLHNSQNILLALIQKGMTRQKSYEIIQTSALKSWESNKNFEEVLNNNRLLKKHLNAKEIRQLCNNKNLKHIERIFKKVFK